MNFRQLEIFVAVAELGSFSRAAEKFYTTPAALTQQLNALERHLDCRLLSRTNRGTVLTDSGLVFLDYARKLLELQQQAEESCRSAANNTPGEIRIGSCRNDTSILQEKLRQFSGICPDIHIRFKNYDYREYFTRLANKEIDLFILTYDDTLKAKGLQFIPLYKTSVAMQMSQSHPLADRERLQISDLRGQNIITSCGCQSHCMDQLIEFLKANEPEVKMCHAEDDNEMMEHLLLHDYLMVNMSENAHSDALYRYVPLDYDAKAYIGIIAEQDPTPAVQRFLNFLKSTLTSVS